MAFIPATLCHPYMSLKDPKRVPRKGQEECARAVEGEELPCGGVLIEGTPRGAWQGAPLPLQPPLSESILSQGRQAWSQE